MIARRSNSPHWRPERAIVAPRVRDYIIIEPSPEPCPRMPARVQDIKQAVVDHYGLTFDDMITSRRTKRLCQPRQLAMYLSRKLTERSLPEIGRLFGGRDHTTVIHAIRQVEYRLSRDPEARAVADSIITRFGEGA